MKTFILTLVSVTFLSYSTSPLPVEDSATSKCICAVKRHYNQPKVRPGKDQWDATDRQYCYDRRNRNRNHHLDVYAYGDKYRNNSVCK